MILPKDQHWPQLNSGYTTASNIDSNIAHLLEQGAGILSVKGNVRTLAFASKIKDELGKAGRQSSETLVEDITNTWLAALVL
ncbi:hypothetical protein IFM61606_10250 [Aspergillus udagawae]|nr:hypothetical protein IFM61606_10250 [Aspergillus udagawae]GFG19926.1 hypothetical protein IFM5058_10380 [Aspergillus udagawae]